MMSNGGQLPTSRENRCIVVCRLHWQAAGKAVSSVPTGENIIYLSIPQCVGSCKASPPHGGGAAAKQTAGASAESAGIIGVSLRVVAFVPHGGSPLVHGGGVGEGAEGSPTSRPAVLVGRSPEQLVPATSADPGVLRACCRHLQAVLLQAARTGEDGSYGNVLLDALDVAMALRLGNRALPALILGPMPQSSAASPIHPPIEGNRTANGGSWQGVLGSGSWTVGCHVHTFRS